MHIRKEGRNKLDTTKTGKTTATLSYGPASSQYPKGGTLTRLNAIAVHPSEPWDSVIQRLLDFYDEHTTGKKSCSEPYNTELAQPAVTDELAHPA
jgi:hypothetical protein